MIQVNDSNELKSKATKGSLADFAEKEAQRIEKIQPWYLLGCAVVIVAEFFLGKAGWFVLPAIFVMAALFRWSESRVKSLRGRSATYKPLKTIHPKRDSYR